MPEALDPVVRLWEVSRIYQRGAEKVIALHRMSLDLKRGEMVALVGPSGCGKSTTLNLVSAVDRPQAGRIEVCGVDLAAASDSELTLLRRRHIGVVFQAFHLFPNLTVEENVALPLSLDGVQDSERVRHLLSRVALEHRHSHYPSELSGGEQQRTAIARALVHKPSVLVADEPTGNLDSANGSSVLELLNELRHEEATALLLATHDLQLAAAADRIVRLQDGVVLP